MPEEALACGSQSTSSTLSPWSAREAERLMAVVVLPTPPFWLTTPRILLMEIQSKGNGDLRYSRRGCGEPGGAVESIHDANGRSASKRLKGQRLPWSYESAAGAGQKQPNGGKVLRDGVGFQGSGVRNPAAAEGICVSRGTFEWIGGEWIRPYRHISMAKMPGNARQRFPRSQNRDLGHPLW